MKYTIFIAEKKFCSYKNLDDAYYVKEFLKQFYKFKKIAIKIEEADINVGS